MVGADGTDVLVADVMAHTTELHLTLQTVEGLRELRHLVGLEPEHIEHQAQGGLAAYARQLGELLYCRLK